MPLLLTKKTSRSNSLGVRGASCPATFTLWLAVSMTRSPKLNTPPPSAWAGMVRARTAFTRATSSRGEKGLTT